MPQILSTYALSQNVAVALAGDAGIRALCQNLFSSSLAVYLGGIGPAADVALPYALVEPAEESHPKGAVSHSVAITVAIDAGAAANTAVARPLGETGVLVVGRGDALQALVDGIRNLFDDAAVGSVLRECDVEFDGYTAYPTMSARMLLQYGDITAF